MAKLSRKVMKFRFQDFLGTLYLKCLWLVIERSITHFTVFSSVCQEDEKRAWPEFSTTAKSFENEQHIHVIPWSKNASSARKRTGEKETVDGEVDEARPGLE